MVASAIHLPLRAFGGAYMSPFDADDAEIERFVAAAATGNHEAWGGRGNRLEPWWFQVLRNRSFIGRLWQREDECRDVVVAVMARLRDDDFHRLNLYLAARREDPELAFLRWLRVLAIRVAIDYLRAHPDYV